MILCISFKEHTNWMSHNNIKTTKQIRYMTMHKMLQSFTSRKIKLSIFHMLCAAKITRKTLTRKAFMWLKIHIFRVIFVICIESIILVRSLYSLHTNKPFDDFSNTRIIVNTVYCLTIKMTNMTQFGTLALGNNTYRRPLNLAWDFQIRPTFPYVSP